MASIVSPECLKAIRDVVSTQDARPLPREILLRLLRMIAAYDKAADSPTECLLSIREILKGEYTNWVSRAAVSVLLYPVEKRLCDELDDDEDAEVKIAALADIALALMRLEEAALPK